MSQVYADYASFIARVPAAFADLDVDAVEAALEDAQAFVGLSLYKAKSLIAHVYFAAYLLSTRFPSELGEAGGDAGAVTSMSAGEIAATFAVAVPASEDSLASNKWGRKFLEISRFVPHTLLAV